MYNSLGRDLWTVKAMGSLRMTMFNSQTYGTILYLIVSFTFFAAGKYILGSVIAACIFWGLIYSLLFWYFGW